MPAIWLYLFWLPSTGSNDGGGPMKTLHSCKLQSYIVCALRPEVDRVAENFHFMEVI